MELEDTVLSAMWMELEDTVLSEVNQKQERQVCTHLHMEAINWPDGNKEYDAW